MLQLSKHYLNEPPSYYGPFNHCILIAGAASEQLALSRNHSTFALGLRQGCVLSPILFVLYMDRIFKSCQGDEGIGVGDVKSRRLLFEDDLILPAFSEIDLQCSMEKFVVECDVTGMRVSAFKTKGSVLSRSLARWSLQINGEAVEQVEKFKYLRVVFITDGKFEELIDRRME
ncbi:unnamed protein product [Soboliphyme baturini]|uniref:Reverse transcriptase domain-containing protein n=1 Tax=Soboliphyme baturini TaxID=241478 RepID=A0A183IQ62_9BILA|nr:unnamed protein product [Soboliphyme baturini]